MNSIFHLFKFLVKNRECFAKIKKLEDFPFDRKMLSCKNRGQFPDLAIRLNKSTDAFSGGELIELKDSVSYTVSSFNSTIPTEKKEMQAFKIFSLKHPFNGYFLIFQSPLKKD